MKLSIIIPVLNEEREISGALASVLSVTGETAVEVIVVDGGSDDSSVETVRRIGGVRLVEYGRAVRGLQMNAGASVARGDILLFLHADVRLPWSAASAVSQALSRSRASGGCFQIRFPMKSPFSLRVMEFGINLRTRLFQAATGDQAIFVRRSVFEAIGGYQEIPLMEDLALFNEIRRRGRVVILDERVEVSPRRWLRFGVWRTMLLMYALRFGYWIGISPETLKKYFIDVR